MAPGIAFLIPLFIACLELQLVASYTSLIARHLIFTLTTADGALIPDLMG